jgi:multiple sugar transport system permease protein
MFQRFRARIDQNRNRPGRLARTEMAYGYFFIAPWIIGFALFTLGPMLVSFGLMFTSYKGFRRINWVGLENIRELVLHDFRLLDSLRVTATYAFWVVFLTILIGLALALFVNQEFSGRNLFRVIYFMPAAISGVALTFVWLALYDKEFGMINQFLRVFDLPRIGWLTTTEWAPWAFVIMAVYGVGYTMVIMLAGLQGIPEHLYDAAKIDGAGLLSLFRHITIPMLSPTIFFLTVIGVIGSMQVFTSGYILTQGGPARSTLFFIIYLFDVAFQQRRLGYASVLAWLFFIIIMLLTLIQFIGARRWVYYEAEINGDEQ